MAFVEGFCSKLFIWDLAFISQLSSGVAIKMYYLKNVCLFQVIHQHGGLVVSTPAQCTHLLALHKKSEVFAKVRSGRELVQ